MTKPKSYDCEGGDCLFKNLLVRRWAERILSQTRLRHVEVEDVEQELWVALLELDAGFSRTVLAPCAAKRVLRIAAATVLRKLKAEQDCKAESKQRRIDPHSIRCPRQSGEQNAIDLAHDVAIVVTNLPWRMGRLARRLMDFSSPEVAARLRVSSSAVYAMIARIRKRFVMSGMVEKRAASLPRKSDNHH